MNPPKDDGPYAGKNKIGHLKSILARNELRK
jgi:hypothetical protein